MLTALGAAAVTPMMVMYALDLHHDAAGAALRGELNLQGEAAKLISEHSRAAHILAIVYVVAPRR